jgi:hypothetical protein
VRRTGRAGIGPEQRGKIEALLDQAAALQNRITGLEQQRLAANRELARIEADETTISRCPRYRTRSPCGAAVTP